MKKKEELKRIFGFLYFSLPLFLLFIIYILFKNNIFRTRARTSKRNKGEKEKKEGGRSGEIGK